MIISAICKTFFFILTSINFVFKRYIYTFVYLQREGYSFVHRDNVLHVGGSIFF
jgi:hypothetical protein